MPTFMIAKSDIELLADAAQAKGISLDNIVARAISAMQIGLLYRKEGKELVWVENDSDREYPFFLPVTVSNSYSRLDVVFSRDVERILKDVCWEAVLGLADMVKQSIATYRHGLQRRATCTLHRRTDSVMAEELVTLELECFK